MEKSTTAAIGDVVTFFVAATTFTWACWIPNAMRRSRGRPINNFLHFIGGAGPLLAAVTVTHLSSSSPSASLSHSEVRSLLAKTFAPCSPLLCAIGFALPVAASAVARLLYRPPDAVFQPWLLPLGFLTNVPILPLEEVGWRAFMQPRILQLFAVAGCGNGACAKLATAMVVGIAWSVWHAPLFFVLKPHLLATPRKTLVPALLSYGIGLASVAFLQGSLVAAAGGTSILPALVVHASLNGSVGAVLGLDKGFFGLWWLFYAPALFLLTHFADTIFLGAL